MRTSLARTCSRRTTRPDVETWARALVADPVRYCASERYCAIVADLLREVTR